MNHHQWIDISVPCDEIGFWWVRTEGGAVQLACGPWKDHRYPWIQRFKVAWSAGDRDGDFEDEIQNVTHYHALDVPDSF